MDESFDLREQYAIRATTARPDERARVLKANDTFAVFDGSGDVQNVGLGEQGLYHEGTRYLSHLQLRLGRQRLLVLGSTVQQEVHLLTVDLANPDITVDGAVVLPKDVLHVIRTKFLWNGACYERIRIVNYGLGRVSTVLSLSFDSDYADVFEVRGTRRTRRGRRLDTAVTARSVRLGYDGLDGVRRHTRISCLPLPQKLSRSLVEYEIALGPREATECELVIACEIEDTPPRRHSYRAAFVRSERRREEWRRGMAQVSSSSPVFDEWITRSTSDLDMLTTETQAGPYPYAGVPWFSCPFGRDGIITALELLWADPRIAHGVLTFLASTQATEADPVRDAQPGKIVHEIREGEMPALGEVPFARYYGSVDATPLFLMLAGAYYERTGDQALIVALWPHFEAAMQWIGRFADLTHDGFLEYARQSAEGLVHQGWKDSQDSVFHADGALAEAPIALCEVQAYAFGAHRAFATLAACLGKRDVAAAHQRAAEALQHRFESCFWCDDLGTYALARDGRKRLCRVRSSNAGHCLWTGIAAPDRATRLAERLMDERSFSGWGIRTIAEGEVRFNPMSYHNGSVWPHDNALIAAGLCRYGYKHAAQRVFDAMFDASTRFDLHRMPELFCGFRRRVGEGPTLYPLACAPQAWSAGVPFLLLASLLGLSIDAARREVTFNRPALPAGIDWLRIDGLSIGDTRVDLHCERRGTGVGVAVLRRDGDVSVVTVA